MNAFGVDVFSCFGEAAEQIQVQLDDAEAVAERVKSLTGSVGFPNKTVMPDFTIFNFWPEAPNGSYGCNESSSEEDFPEIYQTVRWTVVEHSKNLFQEMSCASRHW